MKNISKVYRKEQAVFTWTTSFTK